MKNVAAQEVELEFLKSVKDSTTSTVLDTYLERYPDGEFAPIARALIEHYERQLKAEVAAREQARKRQEEERRAAEVKRIEEQRKVREAALAEERKRAEEAKNAGETKLVEEKQRTEWLARTEELTKALEEVRLAREAAAAAEDQRLEAVKAAEKASKAAEAAIAAKRVAEKSGSPAKLAALPKIEAPAEPHRFDGTWFVTVRSETCPVKSNTFQLTIANGRIVGRNRSGHVSPDGSARWKMPAAVGTATVTYLGSFRGNSGAGTYSSPSCGGRFTARR